MVRTIPLSVARRLSWLAMPLLLFVICCGFCWRLVLSDEYTWLDEPDQVHQEVPRLQFQASQWRHGAFPLWDPHQWCGQPFLGEVVGAANPVNWPFFLVPRRSDKVSIRLLHWYFVYIHFLGALFVYALCRDLERSRAASVAGAVAFAFSGFFGLNGWFPVMGGVLWIPLVFLFLLRVLRGYEPALSATLCGLSLGAAWLSGHHEVPIYLSFTAAAIWLYHIVTERDTRMRLLRLGALALAIATLTSGLQTVPGYEYAKLALRWVGGDHPVGWRDTIPYAVDASLSYRPGSLPGLFVPWFAADTPCYLGVVAVSLALLAAVAQWKQRAVRLFAAVALFALLFAMGSYNVFHGILYAVLPLFGKARVPARMLSLVDFAAAPLVAYGLDGLLARRGERATHRLALALAAGGGAVYLLTLCIKATREFEPNANIAFAALVAVLLPSLLLAWQRRAIGGRFMAWALVALILAENSMVTGAFHLRSGQGQGAWLAKLTAYDDIVGFLKKQPDLVRIDFEESLNLGDLEGIDSLRGFGASVTSNVLDLEWSQPRTQDLLGVNYRVSRAPNRPGQTLVFQGASGFNVYRNPGAFPHVWTVHRTVPANSPDEVRTAIANPATDLRASAPMHDPPPALESCAAPDEARTAGRTANSLTIEAHMACRGMLVIPDTWYPGWKAAIDGRAAPVLKAYGALRGVVVDTGAHTVTLRYRPASAILGGTMTLAGVLATAVLGMIAYRQRRDLPLSRATPERDEPLPPHSTIPDA